MDFDFKNFIRLVADSNNSRMFEVEQLYDNLVVDELTHKLNIRIYTSGSFISLDPNFKDYISLSKFKDEQALEDFLLQSVSDKGGMDTVGTAQRYSYAFHKASALENIGVLKTWGTSKFRLTTVLDLLFYAVSGQTVKDSDETTEAINKIEAYAESHYNEDIGLTIGGYPIEGKWIDLSIANDAFKGFTLKYYKNGKVQIKGISKKEWQRILDLQELCANYGKTFS